MAKKLTDAQLQAKIDDANKQVSQHSTWINNKSGDSYFVDRLALHHHDLGIQVIYSRFGSNVRWTRPLKNFLNHFTFVRK